MTTIRSTASLTSRTSSAAIRPEAAAPCTVAGLSGSSASPAKNNRPFTGVDRVVLSFGVAPTGRYEYDPNVNGSVDQDERIIPAGGGTP
ncbi:unannotated protein [freshwater metagenome]|uniref:Unannotated protein n=1 Tax=freshwater metagenome TaxID=449393 RepID=A0A6J6Y291_9ZZZZ